MDNMAHNAIIALLCVACAQTPTGVVEPTGPAYDPVGEYNRRIGVNGETVGNDGLHFRLAASFVDPSPHRDDNCEFFVGYADIHFTADRRFAVSQEWRIECGTFFTDGTWLQARGSWSSAGDLTDTLVVVPAGETLMVRRAVMSGMDRERIENNVILWTPAAMTLTMEHTKGFTYSITGEFGLR